MESKREAGEDQHGHQPKPQENVNLLIEDVQRQDTKGVVRLNCARNTIFSEHTFGNLKRKIVSKSVLYWSGKSNLCTFGKTRFMGSSLSSGSCEDISNTIGP